MSNHRQEVGHTVVGLTHEQHYSPSLCLSVLQELRVNAVRSEHHANGEAISEVKAAVASGCGKALNAV